VASGKGPFLTPPPNAVPSALDAPTSTRARSKRRSFEIPTLLLLFVTYVPEIYMWLPRGFGLVVSMFAGGG
jgi:hypothetical protein